MNRKIDFYYFNLLQGALPSKAPVRISIDIIDISDALTNTFYSRRGLLKSH